jgi:hypothetical protein
MKTARELPIAVNQDCDQYLQDRLLLLEQQLATVNRLALTNELPDAIITETGLRISPQDAVVPDEAQALIDFASGMLPRIKITELLMDVDDWTGFTRHFVHLKSGEQANDRTFLMSAILADAINLGLTKMAESSPGATYAKLSWLQAWHIRDETYSPAWLNWSTPSSSTPSPCTGGWHNVVVGRPTLPRGRPGREHGPHQPQVRRRTRQAVLHPHFRPVRAVQHQGCQRRRARLDLCARRSAVP